MKQENSLDKIIQKSKKIAARTLLTGAAITGFLGWTYLSTIQDMEPGQLRVTLNNHAADINITRYSVYDPTFKEFPGILISPFYDFNRKRKNMYSVTVEQDNYSAKFWLDSKQEFYDMSLIDEKLSHSQLYKGRNKIPSCQDMLLERMKFSCQQEKNRIRQQLLETYGNNFIMD